MTPADFSKAANTLVIYRGARWAQTFTARNKTTGDPVDLTSYLPFVLSVKNADTGADLVDATIDASNAATGVLLLELTAAQTGSVFTGLKRVRMGMRDNANNPWGEGVVPVLKFTPTPV